MHDAAGHGAQAAEALAGGAYRYALGTVISTRTPQSTSSRVSVSLGVKPYGFTRLSALRVST